MINIENLTNEILNEKNLSSKYKQQWINVKNFYIYYYHGTQGQKAKWLTYDQLYEANIKFSYSIDLFNTITTKYNWLKDLLKFLKDCKIKNDEYIKNF